MKNIVLKRVILSITKLCELPEPLRGGDEVCYRVTGVDHYNSEEALVECAQGDTAAALKILGDILILDPENTAARSHLSLLDKQ